MILHIPIDCATIVLHEVVTLFTRSHKKSVVFPPPMRIIERTIDPTRRDARIRAPVIRHIWAIATVAQHSREFSEPQLSMLPFATTGLQFRRTAARVTRVLLVCGGLPHPPPRPYITRLFLHHLPSKSSRKSSRAWCAGGCAHRVLEMSVILCTG